MFGYFVGEAFYHNNLFATMRFSMDGEGNGSHGMAFFNQLAALVRSGSSASDEPH